MSIGTLMADLVAGIQSDCKDVLLPPEEGAPAFNQSVISLALVRNTRGYLERLVHQINGCYENGWYDACAVMIRRFIEVLIIEAFEQHGLDWKIKNSQGDFLYLSDLVHQTLAEPSWNLSRSTKSALPKLKDIGDKSAHSRRFNAVRSDIDKVIPDLRVTAQEMIYLANFK